MKLRMLGTIGLAAALALTACGGGGNESAAGDEAKTVRGNDSLRYEPETLQAAAGEEFTVNFSNPSNVPHNFVLVEQGQEQAVADAGAANDGEVDDDTPGVIKAGELLDAGTEDPEELEIGELEAGTYTYICTYPGHYAGGMKGTLTVQ